MSRIFSHCAVSVCLCVAARAQGTSSPATTAQPASSLTSPAPLPDAPDAASQNRFAAGVNSVSSPSLPTASRTQMVIEPGEQASPLDAGDKVIFGVRNTVSLFSAAGWLSSAGYEHLTNRSPNYGTDSGAFGERLGAAALRGSSEELFSNAIMAPIFREDPRYYRMGPSHGKPARFLYAITRPLIGRTDRGSITPNLSLWAGNFAGAALTDAYYPRMNRGLTQNLETFGTSLAGSAVGDFFHEFKEDFVQRFHEMRR